MAFTATDAFSTALASDEIMSTFEVGFDFVKVAVDLTRITGAAPTGGGTLGNAIGDTYLAIQKFPEARDVTCFTRH